LTIHVYYKELLKGTYRKQTVSAITLPVVFSLYHVPGNDHNVFIRMKKKRSWKPL